MNIVDIVYEKEMQAICGTDIPNCMRCRPGSRELFDALKADNPSLGEPISDAFFAMCEAFPAARVELERFDDPESEREEPLLYMTIVTPETAAETRAKLDRFLEKWWLDNEWRMKDLVHVGIDFIK